ncbi:MAG: hypothetical protein ACRC62_20655 [Microcoleus sp.]
MIEIFHIPVGTGSPNICGKNKQLQKPSPTQQKIPTYLLRCDTNFRLMQAIWRELIDFFGEMRLKLIYISYESGRSRFYHPGDRFYFGRSPRE